MPFRRKEPPCEPCGISKQGEAVCGAGRGACEPCESFESCGIRDFLSKLFGAAWACEGRSETESENAAIKYEVLRYVYNRAFLFYGDAKIATNEVVVCDKSEAQIIPCGKYFSQNQDFTI